MNTTRYSLPRRVISAFVALAMTVGPLTPGAYAATTTLTDQPIAAKVAAKPNLIYTLDDSGSMNSSYIPDYVSGINPVNTPPGYCRATNGTANQACGTTFDIGYDEPMFASEFNRLYYNPDITYEPPIDGAGNQANAAFPNGACGPNFTSSCATTYKLMNSANTIFGVGWKRVPNDMYLLAPASLPPPVATNTTDLTAKVSMPVFCNTDWPKKAFPDAPVLAVWSEVGDANGENDSTDPAYPTRGSDCRINGNYYAAVSGAPETDPATNVFPLSGYNGYNCPWQKSSGANDPKFFWRVGGNRNIWCRTAGAGWPKSTTNFAGCGAYTCTLGGTLTYNTPQTCVAGSAVTGAPYTYTGTPAVANCNTNPLYQWTWATGGCVGTIGQECLRCDRNVTIISRPATCSITGVSCGTTGGTSPSNPAPPITVNGNPACPNVAGTVPTGCTTGVLTPPPPCNPLANATCNAKFGGLGNASNVAQVGSPSLLDDANGAGDTCRRNNSSGAYVSNRFLYPDSPGTTNNFSKAVNDATCGAIPGSVAIPRYYYRVDSVQYCNAQWTQAANPNHQWRGFGKGTVSTDCQDKNDQTTFKYARYGTMTRVGLWNGNTKFTYTDKYSGATGTRTYAEEMTNYATWFTYYRTRVLAAKTTSAIAFNIVDRTYRAGFQSMNLTSASGFTTAAWLNVDDFTPAHRANWYSALFAISISPVMTPTIDAMIRVGEVVRLGAGAVTGLPAHADPLPTVAGNVVSCTNNYHILFTDGETNQLTLPVVAGEVDGAAIPARSAYNVLTGVTSAPYTLPADYGPSNPERTVASFNAGNWPPPYADALSPTPNSLADVSLYYWMKDLRPTLKNDVPSSDGRAGKDLEWRQDPAFWQHVNFSAISFGSDGLLDSSDVDVKTDQIKNATANWFTGPNYPRPPNSPNVPVQVPATRPATAIDDLWHAAINARGTFVYADTPIEVAAGLGRIISGIGNNQKARVPAAFNGQQLTGTNNFIFEATIDAGWAGELKKVTIDTITGAEGAVRWLAAGGNPAAPPTGNGLNIGLDLLLKTPTPSPLLESDNAWFKDRRIVTRNVDTNTIVPFLHGSIGATNLSKLSANATRAQKMVAYLRGGSTFGAGPSPQVIEGSKIGQFRVRKSKLGNISDSKPLVVGSPYADFTEADDFGYRAFKDGYIPAAGGTPRRLRVYVGANDGMFHVFNGEDNTGANTGGSEVYAYIPSAVFTNAVDEGGKPKGIKALTFQDGGAPIFKHHFYVNASPRTMDVDFQNCGTDGTGACTPNWRTIVVSGMGKGGNTYFAIDATDPAVATEAQAAAKILWEYQLPASEFSYGRPIIAKTRADGWVVVIASGYNNTDDGKGHLYFLRASNGTFIRKLDTTAADTGSVGSPSGLAQINGFTKNSRNQIIEQIYGGDLNGRFWRWDVSDPDPSTWQAKTRLLATLVDSLSAPQPITTAPQIEIDINNGVDRYVFIGTGRLLDASDLTTPSPEQQQTMYAMRDGTLDAPTYAGLPIVPRTTLASASGIAGVGAVAPDGWYNDLPLGQRIVNDVQADLNLVAYSGTAVQPDPCLTSLPAYIYARDFTTAESLIFTGGVAQPYYYSLEGAVGLELVALDSGTSSFPKLAIVFTRETNASIQPVEVRPKSFTGGHRLSWRLLGE